MPPGGWRDARQLRWRDSSQRERLLIPLALVEIVEASGAGEGDIDHPLAEPLPPTKPWALPLLRVKLSNVRLLSLATSNSRKLGICPSG